jgi:hypothetical protein
MKNRRSYYKNGFLKFAQIEAGNINVGVSLLEKELPVFMNRQKQAYNASQSLDELQQHRDNFVKKNKLDIIEV